MNRIVLYILLFFAGMVAAQENARTEALEKTILFYGMVQDSSFAPGEKLNVEILETGDYSGAAEPPVRRSESH